MDAIGRSATDQLNLVENDRQLAWTEAFSSCDDPTYWHQIFKDCQPKSCNATSVADTIINAPRPGMHQYWIYGYVLRSPVIINIGCYSLKASVKNEFHRGIFSFEHNSAFECSMACPDDSVKYIFLRGRECLCIPKKRYDDQLFNNVLLQENTGTCNQSCAGNSGDLCGCASVVDGKLLYSVFQVITSKFYKETCPNGTASWYAAQQNCQEQGLQLQSYTTPSFSSECVRNQQTFWIGNHVGEKIIWANNSLPKDPLCLKLVITKSGSTFETENCSRPLYSLCYKQQHTSSGKNDETYTTKSTQFYSSTGRTTLRSPVNTESDSDEDKTDFIPIVAGNIGGFLAIVIVVIIVFIIKRRLHYISNRKKSNHKHVNTTVDQRQPETYSEPIENTVPEESRKLVIENTILEESRKLVNVTEEGIYNHLGDSEKMIEMKPQDSSIYDITGDDEYHMFTGSGKQQKFKDNDDLYDHGASSDVYNTLNDTVTTNKPESDTYNVINTK
ncbi:unnamed protein product [Mytilus coruscus]|uniref:WSC domain-containing protein n=1 Tax=Mytilus coruscus TaxID=42192 RepID=A0A6J8CWF2_MYTCO|nr:unnamed protein product [Mytilus coruscus]